MADGMIVRRGGGLNKVRTLTYATGSLTTGTASQVITGLSFTPIAFAAIPSSTWAGGVYIVRNNVTIEDSPSAGSQVALGFSNASSSTPTSISFQDDGLKFTWMAMSVCRWVAIGTK